LPPDTLNLEESLMTALSNDTGKKLLDALNFKPVEE
jgi:hypothetical protein